MARDGFPGKSKDFKWGRYDYPVTKSQKRSLDALWYLLSGLPREYMGSFEDTLAEGSFYSQDAVTGNVTFGLCHKSVTVDRRGRLMSNH